MFPHTDGIMDMFPHTGDIHTAVSGHVECVALLSNRNADKKGYITLDVNLDDYYRIKNDGSIKD